ncbi:actin filament-associated protein 1-like 1 isoform X2 [Scleropages formosus]|uniref:actin filament-associated protein 1-like 1 isoform X2 n=1 Tax=Scleropages formosus TaxID=113540 RepID=UPI000878FEC9|nr:actin filament-associated protein 1-like 1 isoform X2 [Scleropages formosus]
METDFDSCKSMEHLVAELNVLLKLLDHETLSAATAEKKTAVRNLLKQLKPSLNGTDYMYMNTSIYRNGTSFVESLFEEFDCDLRDLKDAVEEQKDEREEETPETETPPPKSSPADTPPPLPTTPPPEDYYEEAVPLSPGKSPQYITTRVALCTFTGSSSPPNSIEDGYYEDADNNYPTTRINGHRKNSYNDSDALSSSYESYDEEDEETKAQRLTHQWPSEENSMGPVKDCRICAFLLRKKRFGQWAKQLTVIRENRLLCYKSSKDHTPYMDLPLKLCTVTYVPKDGRRKKHELRFSLPGGEALVLAVQSKEQAEGWIRIIREVSSQGSSGLGLDGTGSPSIVRKVELDKRLSADKQTSDSDSVATGDNVSSPVTREGRDQGKAKRAALSELTGSVSRAAGRKITRIISFSKKKPPLPGDHHTSPDDDDPRSGYLGVLVNQCWKERWCSVRGSSLYLHRDRSDLRTHINVIPLQGCEVVPGLGPKHPFALRIMRGGNEVAALEATCSEEMGRWLGILMAETGCTSGPESLHYDYVDVDTIANIRDAARHSFLWATSSSSASTDSRTYDEVPYEKVQPEEQSPKAGAPVKRHSSFSNREMQVDPAVTVKRHGSNANQYGKYGKTRAEEDARKYLSVKEALEKERDGIRSALLSLRKEKRVVKEELKSAAGKQKTTLEERLAELEECCKKKEADRVDLELKLTEVKENLKKSLAGGVLGAPVEVKPASMGSKTECPYSESSLPVNCASEIRKRPSSIYASAKGNVMQKAKEWESKKGT